VSRFALKEGQNVRISGMTKYDGELHGMIGIYLGVFKALERLTAIEVIVDGGGNGDSLLSFIDEKARKAGFASWSLAERRSTSRGMTVINLIPQFPQNLSEGDIMRVLVEDLEKRGCKVVSTRVIEKEIERKMMDPSEMLKLPKHRRKAVTYKWVL